MSNQNHFPNDEITDEQIEARLEPLKKIIDKVLTGVGGRPIENAESISALSELLQRNQIAAETTNAEETPSPPATSTASDYVERGKTLLQQGKHQEAIDVSQQAIDDIESNLIEVYWNQVFAYWHLQEYSSAIDACEQLLRIKPDDETGYYYLGLAHKNLQQYDKAKAAFEQAIRIKPDNASAKEELEAVQQLLEEPINTPVKGKPDSIKPEYHSKPQKRTAKEGLFLIKPNHQFLIKPNHQLEFILLYVLVTLVSWGMGTLAVVLLAETHNNSLYAFFGLAWGVVGVAQYLVLRSYSEWNHLNWILYTALGALIGTTAFFFLFRWNPFELDMPAIVIGVVAGTGVAVGGLQWLGFRSKVKAALLWILTTTIASTVGGALAGVVSHIIYTKSPAPLIDKVIAGVAAAALFGLIVGTTQACHFCFLRKKNRNWLI